MPNTKQDWDYADFLAEFWDYDKSPYVREKLRKARGIHRRYCGAMLSAVKTYWAAVFKDRRIGSITRQDISDFAETLESGWGGRKTRLSNFYIHEHRISSDILF